MQTLFVVLLFFIFLKFVENRWCSGVSGLECCSGYTLNTSTGNCEKCRTGYTGDCSTRCIPPSFGEECQSVCNCSDGFYCHFIYGCSQHKRSKTTFEKSSSTIHVSPKLTSVSISPPVTTEGKTVSPLILTRDISKIVTKPITTSVNNLSKDDDFFKNIYYVFFIIIALIGVFVLFFTFFVGTYIYLKCFPKTSNSRETRKNESQSHYKSLDFEATVAETTVHQTSLEQRGRLESDSAYLSPVFVRNERLTESRGERENENNEIVLESVSLRQEYEHQAINSSENIVTMSTGDQSEHVYIEITDGQVEPTNITDGEQQRSAK